ERPAEVRVFGGYQPSTNGHSAGHDVDLTLTLPAVEAADRGAYSSRWVNDVAGRGPSEVNRARSSEPSLSRRGVADRLGALGAVTDEDAARSSTRSLGVGSFS